MIRSLFFLSFFILATFKPLSAETKQYICNIEEFEIQKKLISFFKTYLFASRYNVDVDRDGVNDYYVSVSNKNKDLPFSLIDAFRKTYLANFNANENIITLDGLQYTYNVDEEYYISENSDVNIIMNINSDLSRVTLKSNYDKIAGKKNFKTSIIFQCISSNGGDMSATQDNVTIKEIISYMPKKR